MNIKKLDVKNRVFALPEKLVNIFDFIPKKLDIQKEGDNDSVFITLDMVQTLFIWLLIIYVDILKKIMIIST